MATPRDNPVTLFGEVSFRSQTTQFGIKLEDRYRHVYIIGKSGMGKSELLKLLAIQDIREGRGLAFIDPHGDPVEDLLDFIPPERLGDVIYINPADMQFPVGFNVMENIDYDMRHLVADGMMAVFKKIWVDQWSARMEYILNYTILALLEAPGSTLLGVNRMLAEKEYRRWVTDQVKDPEVKAFWLHEFAKYNDRYAQEATAAIQNKIGQFVANSLIRNIIGQPTSSFDLRKAMDERKIILVNISRGRIGEDASRLLGAMLITKIQLAAMSRVDVPRQERAPFTLIVDEFQHFATASFAGILSEARKFNLSLVVAHQYVKQMSEEVSDAVFGNVGTIISFRVGAEDAELLEKEFAPEFMVQDIVNLGFRQIYLKLMIDGVASRAFSARTMDTPAAPTDALPRDQVIAASRATYGRERALVEEVIAKWRAPMAEPEVPRRENRPQGPRQPYIPPKHLMPGPARAELPQHQPSQSVRMDRPPRRDDRNRPSRRERGHGQDRGQSQGGPRPTPAPVSLGALGQGAVDFRGNKVEDAEGREPKQPPKDVDRNALKKMIEEALKKKSDQTT